MLNRIGFRQEGINTDSKGIILLAKRVNLIDQVHRIYELAEFILLISFRDRRNLGKV